jgi:hypothetical protein
VTKVGLYPWKRPFLSLHLIEWSLVAALIVALALVFTYKVHVVRGQAELAAVKSTLGALRTALVIDHLHTSVTAGASAASSQPNPFALLQRRPSNYFGQWRAADAETVSGGSWVFDQDCVCVGYLPIYPEWLDSPSGDTMAWYRVEGAPGPRQLTAKEAYRWQGQVLN